MNRLKQSRSLYLKQHADNPVHWWPWSAAALAHAKSLDRVILVSIGYSTCHWCHVMEHESFEDEEVAAVLNSHFVCIKVDREEHPEVDRFYMDALLKIQGNGGWPLNMFTLPDGKPIVGGTYFPKQNLLKTLSKIQEVWTMNRAAIVDQAQMIVDAVNDTTPEKAGSRDFAGVQQWVSPAQTLLIEQQLRSFDPVWGGFGRAPKFPRAHGIGALLRAAKNSSDEKRGESAFFSALHTLKCMAFGGLRDHLGGGFHRYSTDEEWLAPHFEKMLYDQALMMEAYSEAYALTEDPFFKEVVRDIFEYCQAVLRQYSGLYGAGEDADSEGTEGKFYVWSLQELTTILEGHPKESREKFLKLYAPSESGNWEKTNILRVMPSFPSENLFDPMLSAIRRDLLERRSKRPRPVLDPKAIVEWNSLLALAFLRSAFQIGRDPAFSKMLQTAGQVLLKAILKFADDDFAKIPRIYYPNGNDGSPILEGKMYLADASALALSLQYAAILSGEKADLERAKSALQWMIANFKSDGQWKASRVDEGLHLNSIDEDDGALPSALSLLAGALLRGARLFENEEFMQEFLRLMPRVRENLIAYPLVHSFLLSELDGISAPLIKVPPSLYGETLGRLSEAGFLLTEVILKRGSQRFEICRWQQCDWTGETISELVSELQKRRTDRLTSS